MKPTHYLTCGLCGWVHFPISREYAEQIVKDQNNFIEADGRPEDQRPYHYFQRATIEFYEHCHNPRCHAHYTEMKPSKPEDCPTGVTLQPIIVEGV